MSSAIETEIIEATEFTLPKGGYKERQDYLAALAKATGKLSDDEYDALTDDTADWIKDAIKAIKAKDEIEDFPDLEDEDAEPEADEEAEAEEAAEEQDEEPNEEVADDEPQEEAEEAPDGEPDEVPEDDAEAEADIEAAEAAEDAKARTKRKLTKSGKRAKKPGPKKRHVEHPMRKAPPDRVKEHIKRYDLVTGERDRFGCLIGSKTSEAVKLYSRPDGVTSAEMKKQLDGRYYNILT
jgi:hypothetical protein